MSKGMLRRKPRRLLERARLLIEQAEAMGEPPEDPLLLFSVLYGFWVANYVAFNGDADARACGTIPGARGEARNDCSAHDRSSPHGDVFASSLGKSSEVARTTIKAIALYDPSEHRALAERFGQDVRVAILSYRPLALWLLGYPDAALADTEQSLREAREIGQATTLMYALGNASLYFFQLGDYARAMRGCRRACPLSGAKGRRLLEGVRNDE